MQRILSAALIRWRLQMSRIYCDLLMFQLRGPTRLPQVFLGGCRDAPMYLGTLCSHLLVGSPTQKSPRGDGLISSCVTPRPAPTLLQTVLCPGG